MTHRILTDEGIAIVEPIAALTEADFKGLAATVNAYLEDHETLNGLLIRAEAFPGWENFSGFLSHLKFIREHHQKIRRIALAVDGPLSAIAPHLASHFIAAEIRHFASDQEAAALAWLKSAEN